MKKALIVGATGLVGRQLVGLLQGMARVRSILLLNRRPWPFDPHKVENHEVDFDQLDQWAERVSGYALFITLGTTMAKAGSKEAFELIDRRYVVNLAKAAEGKVPKLLVVTAIGANPKATIFYNQVKGLVEEDLKQLHFEQLEIFRPSMLDGRREEFRLGERVGLWVMKLLAPLLFGKAKRFRPIHVRTVARAMAHRALTDDPGIHTWESDEIQRLATSK